MQIGLVYDEQVRRDTTGVHLHTAIRRRADTVHIRPFKDRLAADSDVDFYVLIDDGLEYEIPDTWRPRAAWAIDTHLGFDRCIGRFGDADLLFAAQRHDAFRLSETLGRTVHWLPLACDPAVHCPVPQQTVAHDVVFVGNTVNRRRERWLAWLHQHFPSCWSGQAYFTDMSRAWSSGKIGVNCSVAGDVNIRVFEIAACGLPVLTDRIYNNGLESLFELGREILTWESEADLHYLIQLLLKDETLRRQIATAGQQAVLQRHTYGHRAELMLERIRQHAVRCFRPAGYYEFDRPEVRMLIPRTAGRILDIGCGSGRLGAVLKTSRPCHVTGIDSFCSAAIAARKVLDEVHCRSIGNTPAEYFPAESFDCIILADVLEHLRDPDTTLGKCARWLASSGTLVLSVPNSRNHEVLEALADGNWSYESAGLLDDDHVRCFTRREIEKLLFRSGFSVSETRFVHLSGTDPCRSCSETGSAQFQNLTVRGLSRQDSRELFAYQILMTARKSTQRQFGLTSIIVVTFNQLAYTRMCVDSVLRRTDEPIELIFVDNGSTDGTVDFLQTIPRATLLRNPSNQGFARAVNQGLRTAKGDQILLLNNDVIVTTGWLTGLLEGLYSAADMGLIGPVSNCVSGQQQVPPGYSVLSSLDGFAWERQKRPQWIVTSRLVGFCLLFRRSVLQQIGDLDERFEIGCFEDDDFCRRATAAGYRLSIANHIFVHHFGSATFRGAGISLASVMQQNGQRFAEKWSTNQSFTDRNRKDSATADRVSLCMIVRDNEAIIEACLTSIRPWVDEMIVVDTGSLDQTAEICHRLGAHVFEFPWCDDFSAARNESIRHATGDWIFWMDSDDVMDPIQGERLQKLVRSNHKPQCHGYVLQVHCLSEAAGQATVVDHVKLFRNRSDLRFEHRIHEQILPAIRRAHGTVEFTDIHVVHHGSRQSPEQHRRKLERDFRILRLDLQEHPEHPFILFNLGMTCDDAGLYQDAIGYLEHSLRVSGPEESHVPKTWSILINSLRLAGAVNQALQRAEQALKLYPDDVELRFRYAVLLQQSDQNAAAIQQYRSLLVQPVARRFRSMDNSIMGYKLYHNLAVALDRQGNSKEAADHWEQALPHAPDSEAAQLEVARHSLRSGNRQRLQELSTVASRSQSLIHKSQIQAMAAFCNGDLEATEHILWDAWATTASVECLDELARLMLEHGHVQRAVAPLKELAALRPLCGATQFNLGQSLLHCGEPGEARRHLQLALSLRPLHEPARRLLDSLSQALSMTEIDGILNSYTAAKSPEA